MNPNTDPTENSAAAAAVDVVISTRNRPDLLRQAIAAVAAQDHPGPITTHVVFDQCDPDLSVARTDAHRPVQVLGNHRSPGLAGGRNSGIEHGSAPFVAFCDDDDLWLPHKISTQLALLQGPDGQPLADTCVSGIVVEYADRSVTRVPRAEDLALATLVRRRVMEAHPSSVLVRRTALLDGIGLVDEEIPGSYGEDFDWILRAAQHGPVAVAPEPLVRVRWGGSQFSQDWQTIVDAIDYGLAKNPVLSSDRRGLARLRGRRAFALAALGRRREALAAAWQTFRTHPHEPRAPLAGAVALRLVSSRTLMHLAHRRGRGI